MPRPRAQLTASFRELTETAHARIFLALQQ